MAKAGPVPSSDSFGLRGARNICPILTIDVAVAGLLSLAHAPFWLASPEAGAAILINNATPEGVAFTLHLHGPDGALLDSQEHFIDSAASLTIPVSDFPEGPVEAGYAVLEYPAAFRGRMPAQMVVSSAEESFSANYLFQEKRNAVNPEMHWAFWIPSAQSDLYLMLLNRSDEPIDAMIISRVGEGESGQELQIAPGAMQRLRWRESLAAGLRTGAAGGIRLSHSGGSGDLLAEGFVLDPRRGISYTLDRFDFDSAGSTNLVFPLLRYGTMPMGKHEAAFRPLAVLSNGSLSPMEVQPLVRLDGGEAVQLDTWILQPLESKAVDLHRLLRRQLPSVTSFEGSLELAHSGEPGDLAATVLSSDARSDRIYQSAVKQEDRLALGYSYPFRLSQGWNTRIYLTNRTAQPVVMCVFLHFDGQSYTWSGTKELAPFESRSVDIGQLRDEQVPDEFGTVIPLDTASGQAIVVVHDEDPASVATQAVIENVEAGLALPSACSVCPPSDIKLYLRKNRFDPEFTMASYLGFPGEKERIYAVVRNSLGGEKDISFFASYSSSDPGIAKVEKSFGKAEVKFLQPGFAEEIGATFSGCFYEEPLGGCGGFFEEGECECFCQSVPLSVPEGGAFGGANPAAEALVLQPTVGITGPGSITVGEPPVALTTQTQPAGGTLSNWRVLQNATSDPSCVDLSGSGLIKAFADGSVQVQVDYTVGGVTVSSQPFTLNLAKAPQVVQLLWQTPANNILMVNHAANINQIRNRVEDRVRTRLTGSGANLLVQGTFPPGVTQRVTISIDGNGPPAGNAPYDLLNKQRNLAGFVRIGTGSLDLANMSDPVTNTATNERTDWERVADAIARLVCHEIGHTLGMTARNSEVMGNALAQKLNVHNLGLGGDANHHSGTMDWHEVMNASAAVNRVETWNFGQYDFTMPERTYLARILP